MNPDWQMFDHNEISPGTLRIAAFSMYESIERGSDGTIVKLTFRVRPGAKVNDQALNLRVLDLRDDLSGFVNIL